MASLEAELRCAGAAVSSEPIGGGTQQLSCEALAVRGSRGQTDQCRSTGSRCRPFSSNIGAPIQREAQRAESELTLLKPRLADLAAQLARSQQEILKLEGDVAILRAAAQESALEILASDRFIEQLLDEISSKEENLKRLKQEKIDRQERAKRIYEEHLKRLEKLETRASFGDSCSSHEHARDEAMAIQALRDKKYSLDAAAAQVAS